jgi:hypothetical protein
MYAFASSVVNTRSWASSLVQPSVRWTTSGFDAERLIRNTTQSSWAAGPVVVPLSRSSTRASPFPGCAVMVAWKP